MIDLHCHLLPGIDDGSKDLRMSIEMARTAAEDGISTIACTPHILPTVYDNDGPTIEAAVGILQKAVDFAGIPVQLVAGADVHVAPDLVDGLRSGRILSLKRTRHLLLEPPHHVPVPRFDEYIFSLQAAGFVPIITHPERLSWIESHYEVFQKLWAAKCMMQLTAGSFVGRFGRRPQYWAERMLDEGLCHIIATDAHNLTKRRPCLSEGRDAAAKRVGDAEALNLVEVRPRAILADVDPAQMPPPPGAVSRASRNTNMPGSGRGRFMGWLRGPK